MNMVSYGYRKVVGTWLPKYIYTYVMYNVERKVMCINLGYLCTACVGIMQIVIHVRMNTAVQGKSRPSKDA